jgi:DNA polymerase III epsilon subunit family exonuclease
MMSNVTVVDFETTGLFSDRGDRITEIGAIKMSGNRICGIFQTLVNPGRKIPEISTSLTGITDEMVKDAPFISEVLPLFVDFAGEDTLVMHNADFDGGFLRYELKHLKIEKEYSCFCTLKTARKSIKSPNFKLSTLKNILNLHTYGSMHRALSDTFVTAQLFLILEKNFGIDTLSNMEKDISRLLKSKNPQDIYVIDPYCS